MRGRGLGRVLSVLAALLASACLVASPARAIDYVDGISDQHLGGWVAALSPAPGLSAPFASPLVSGPLPDGGEAGSQPRLRLARYVVQWDVMSGAGYAGEFAHLQQWYDTVIALGLTPDLALANYDCAGCVTPASLQSFAQALQALHSRFPAIAVYEAWNEPNLPGSFHLPAALAAQLMNVTYAFCARRACTALAGDFSDAPADTSAYERRYERYLSPRDPGNWAIHLYRAVKYETLATLRTFVSLLPSPRSDSVWLTELGAYYCEFGDLRGAAAQARNAAFLVQRLIPAADPAHVFYYQGAWPYDTTPPCTSDTQDTALYAAQVAGGPLVSRPAAEVVFGPEDPPGALSAISLALTPAAIVPAGG